MNNLEILERMNSVVKGHLPAKKALINLANRSYTRYYRKDVLCHSLAELPTNQNVLLIGESGTGKTLLVDTLQEILDFPLIRYSAPELNPTGAQGGVTVGKMKKEIMEYATYLVKNSNKYYSVEGVLSQMVIFIDEIDKICKPSDSSGNWNEHVQHNFLKIFENKDDFNSLSFVFAGAFTGMDSGEKKKTLGFNADITKDTTSLDSHLIKFGMITELVGRIHSIVKLDMLKKEDYFDILENYVYPIKAREFSYMADCEFVLSQEQKESIVEIAMKSGQGVRMLNKQVDTILTDLEFDNHKSC